MILEVIFFIFWHEGEKMSHREIEKCNKDVKIIIKELELKVFNSTWHKYFAIQRPCTLIIDKLIISPLKMFL